MLAAEAVVLMSITEGCTTKQEEIRQRSIRHSGTQTPHLVQNIQRDRVAHIVHNDAQDCVLLLILRGTTLHHLGCLQCCLGVGVLFRQLCGSTHYLNTINSKQIV